MINETPFYTASELAKKANISPSYVARLCRAGEIPATKVGTVWLIQIEDATEWLEARSESERDLKDK